MGLQPSPGRWPLFCRSVPWPLVGLLLAAMILGLSGLDRLAAESIRTAVSPDCHAAAKAVSRLGQSEVYVIPALLLLLWAWRLRPDRRICRLALWLLVSMAAGGLVVRLLKIAFGRWRPSQLADGHFGFALFSFKAKLNAFPSGHACDAMIAATVLWFAWPRLRPLYAAWFVLIAAARLVALDHFPSDVAAGALIGLLCALALRTWKPITDDR